MQPSQTASQNTNELSLVSSQSSVKVGGTPSLSTTPQTTTGATLPTFPHTLTGGGARWTVENNLPGLGIGAASLGNQGNAYDAGLQLMVNGQPLVAPIASATTNLLTTQPVRLASGLDVTVQYFAVPDDGILRTLVSFRNPSNSTISTQVDWATDVGSDAKTTIAATSDNDTVVETSDRWIITEDGNALGGDVANLHVLFGSGRPAVTPAQTSATLASGAEGILSRYNISVPGNATRSLLFFNGIAGTTAGAQHDTSQFESVSRLLGTNLLNGLTAQQRQEVLNWDLSGTATLTGGGATWTITNDLGTSNQSASGGEIDDVYPGLGFGVLDAAVSSHGDAVDGGMMLFVNNQQFVAPTTGNSQSGRTYTTGEVAMSGLNVKVQYHAMAHQPVLRSLVSFRNPTNADITIPVSWATNVGSDSNTTIVSTSSGDRKFTVDDRWIITDDSGTVNDDPALTHVLYGFGNPTVKPTAVSQTVFRSFGTQGVLADYQITIPANSTRSLMFFNGVNGLTDSAQGHTALYESVAALRSNNLLEGLSTQQLNEILNWQGLTSSGNNAGSGTGNGSQPDTIVEGVANTNPNLGVSPERLGTPGRDVLLGDSADNILVGGRGADLKTGGTGADRFLFRGKTQRGAFANSLMGSHDHITDFRFSEGDRIVLDTDNDLTTPEFPVKLFNAGRVRGPLPKAIREAYADKNQQRPGNQALRANEAVIFSLGSRTYLSVNDNRNPFNAKRDMVVDITGIELKPGDAQAGVLAVNNYFA